MRGVTLPTLAALFGVASVGHLAQVVQDLQPLEAKASPSPPPDHEGVRKAALVRMSAAEVPDSLETPEARLGALYGAMPRDRAARLLAGLEPTQAASVLSAMPSRQAGQILGVMPPARAAAVADALARGEGD